MQNRMYLLAIGICVVIISWSIVKSKAQVEMPEKLTNQETLMNLYTKKILPLFSEYDSIKFPSHYVIDKNDNTINAGAASGYIEVSQGLVDAPIDTIRIFVMAHELAHMATLAQASLFNLGNEIPNGKLTNIYKKAELLADLIAFYKITVHLPKMARLMKQDFNVLKILFGNETFTHPSGKRRIEQLLIFAEKTKTMSNVDAFKVSFTDIWEME
ncbi:hypothetical protein [Flavivirga spongiicola]|uniref:Peptidase M48 domain-containing protein n=1 Tax=Flavivirga spongiicola TaxID=421621 RepID=A0ABU7XMF5_9FLAO|nr:hypothetical protein [Flavivirga sp. MEBiC05379]MDO5981379.1 hypothetical protein [Flavivirga sp. MEBiC05379]